MKTRHLLLLVFTTISFSCINTNQRSNQVKADLTPDEWLAEWNFAYNECYSFLPPLPPTTPNFDPNEDLMEQATFLPIVNWDNEVEALILKYPELFAYRQKVEYEKNCRIKNKKPINC